MGTISNFLSGSMFKQIAFFVALLLVIIGWRQGLRSLVGD